MDAVTLALLKALVGGSGSSGLPSTGSASAGDVLSLDDNKEPQWAAPSGGGGVLVVHDVEGTLDKTWQEIHDAMESSLVVVLYNSTDAELVSGVRYESELEDPYVVSVGEPYFCSNTNDYPSSGGK